MRQPKTQPPDADVRLDQLLCYAIYSAGHALNRVYKPLLDPLGLTYPKYLVMVALWERENETVGELGARLSLESNTLTPLLKRMEADGFIRRTRDPADERQVRIALTPKGRALSLEARAIPGCVFAASGLKLENVQRLQSEISALRDALTASSPVQGTDTV